MRAFCSVIIVDCSSSDKLSISDKSSYGESRPASYLSKSSSLLGNGSKRYLFAFFFEASSECVSR